jgi:REP element-mobilizing transposase RayT
VYPERKSKRLIGWDYSSSGIYFVTICCNDRQSFLGHIFNNTVLLSEIGMKANEFWSEIPKHFKHVKLDEFIIMPNHIHGLLIIDYSISEPYRDQTRHTYRKNHFSQPVKDSVSVIVNQYKSSLKRWCNQNGFDFFKWQYRFFDEIIRNDDALENSRAYIRNNPKNWKKDENFV